MPVRAIIAIATYDCYFTIPHEEVNCKIAIAQKGANIVNKKGSFDNAAFYSALDASRIARKLTWKAVADLSGVSASTLTRMAQGRRPDVDGLAALSSWSGLDINNFIRTEGDKSEPEPLAMISTYLKGDRNLSNEAAIALEEIIKATYERLRNDSK